MTIPGDKWIHLQTGEVREVDDVVGKTIRLTRPDGANIQVLLRDLQMTHCKVSRDS